MEAGLAGVPGQLFADLSKAQPAMLHEYLNEKNANR
jgi:hypothetical protein